jgi:hypothetical protein
VHKYGGGIHKVITVGLTWRRAGSSDRNVWPNLSLHTKEDKVICTLKLIVVVGLLVLITLFLAHGSGLGINC